MASITRVLSYITVGHLLCCKHLIFTFDAIKACVQSQGPQKIINLIHKGKASITVKVSLCVICDKVVLQQDLLEVLDFPTSHLSCNVPSLFITIHMRNALGLTISRLNHLLVLDGLFTESFSVVFAIWH
jgi:hypothetical protein